jgi:hypothetical protein
MAIQIGNYNFEGPFSSVEALRNTSGVYAILGSNQPQQFAVLDVGESATLRDRVGSHDRQNHWRQCGYLTLFAAALYTDAHSRMRIESELRVKYQPPCGIR